MNEFQVLVYPFSLETSAIAYNASIVLNACEDHVILEDIPLSDSINPGKSSISNRILLSCAWIIASSFSFNSCVIKRSAFANVCFLT